MMTYVNMALNTQILKINNAKFNYTDIGIHSFSYGKMSGRHNFSFTCDLSPHLLTLAYDNTIFLSARVTKKMC
jgi:hypothetical protein